MTPFFETKLDQARLVYEATEFVGTPFHHHGRVKGGGVDCVGLLAEVYIAVGAAKAVKFPEYRINEWNKLTESKVRQFLEGDLSTTLVDQLKMVEVNKETDLLPGDIITVKIKTVIHHVGMMLWPLNFIHAYVGRGVLVSSLAHQAYQHRLAAVYRIMRL